MKEKIAQLDQLSKQQWNDITQKEVSAQIISIE